MSDLTAYDIIALEADEDTGSLVAVVAARGPDDPGAFAHPNEEDPYGIWAKRVAVRIVVDDEADR